MREVDLSSQAIIFSREMGLTHAEFFRTLPSAMGDLSYQINGLSVIAQQNDKALQIMLGPQQQRRIALLNIPFVTVEFSFSGYMQTEVDAFMRYFDSRYQRGGG